MRSRIAGAVQLVLDLVLVAGSYYVVYFGRGALGFPYTPQSLGTLGQVLPWLLVVFAVLYFVYGLGTVAPGTYYEAFLGLALSVGLLALITFALSFLIRQFGVPRTMVALAGLVQMVGLSILNGVLARAYRKKLPCVSVLCVAASEERAERLSALMSSVQGFAGEAVVWNEACQDVGVWLAATKAVVLDDSLDAAARQGLLVKLTAARTKVFVVPQTGDLLLQNPLEFLAGDQLLLEVQPLSYRPADDLFKRLLDILVAVLALVLFSPLFALATVMILADGGRPVYYRQERLGRGGCRFRAIKFRTMVRGAEDDTGPILTIDGDARITRVGRFLRKTGLDEVPQFLNVLRGEMSIVGPRPERPELARAIEAGDPDFALRTAVKPGITGLAQIRGGYSTNPHRKLTLDISYLRQGSVLLSDIYIILNTLRMFFLPSRRK